MSRILQRFFILIVLATFAGSPVYAGIEPISNHIKGVLKADTTVEVKDEKFKNPSVNWQTINNIAVKNRVYLRLVENTPITQAFSCEVDVRIEYFTTPQEVSPHVINSVKLNVNYIPGVGATYRAEDAYYMEGAYQLKVIINGISSPQYGSQVPHHLELGASVVADRIHPLSIDFPVQLTGTIESQSAIGGVVISSALKLNWSTEEPSEEYDIEWALIDTGSDFQELAARMVSNDQSLTDELLNDIFRNNAARISTQANNYDISLVYNSKYIIVRIRGVNYDPVTGIRDETGGWSYRIGQGTNGNGYAIWDIDNKWHWPALNWQYQASYAEEGKKKEVISYFDGSFRNRQTVTLNNEEEVAVVQENIYDEYGRVAANVLPAPVISTGQEDKKLRYFPDFNKKTENNAYSFTDLNFTNCEPLPAPMYNGAGSSAAINGGAAWYYSPVNSLIEGDEKYNRYIPDAEGYPFSVTQYTNDNTGRIRMQGGVGTIFQPAGTAISKTTKYYYAKPEQWELDRIFGNDVGFAERYQKNMVVDPNGNVSISYINASGKTIATALTGNTPASQDALPSTPAPYEQTSELLNTGQFKLDQSSLKVIASTTYVSSVIGEGMIDYDIEQLIAQYQRKTFSIENNAFYRLYVDITNHCGDSIYNTVDSTVIMIGSASLSEMNTGRKSGRLTTIPLSQGEYYITFTLAMDKSVISGFADNFIQQAQLEGSVDREFKVVKAYLDQLNVSDCYNDCNTCDQLLGEDFEFLRMAKTSITQLGLDTAALNTSEMNELDSLLATKYIALKAQCNTLKATCKASLSSSPCESFEKQMRTDVSPGGQYALFKSDYTPIELSLNVLMKDVNHKPAWRNVFPSGAEAPGSDEYNKTAVFIPEEDREISPYDGAFKPEYLVKYWKSDWADRFLIYHPEYCRLQQCKTVLNTSLDWDKRIQDNIITEEDITGVNTYTSGYDRENPDWLVMEDPFFNSAAGAQFIGDMWDELWDYSHTALKYPEEALIHRTITEYVDYITYCNPGQEDKDLWNTSCAVPTNCRVTEREWDNYKRLYFRLKEKYYQKYYESMCGTGCPIGVPPSPAPLNRADGCLAQSDFLIEKYVREDGVPDPIAGCSGQNIVKITYTGGQAGTRNIYLRTPDEYGYTGNKHLVFNLQGGSQYICFPENIPVDRIKIKSACISPRPNYTALLTSQQWKYRNSSYMGYINWTHTFSSNGNYSRNGVASGQWTIDNETEELTIDGTTFHIESISSTTLILSHYAQGKYREEYYSYVPTNEPLPVPAIFYGEYADEYSEYFIVDRYPDSYDLYKIIWDEYDPDYNAAQEFPKLWMATKNWVHKYTNTRIKIEENTDYGGFEYAPSYFHVTRLQEYKQNYNLVGTYLTVRPNVGVRFAETEEYTVNVKVIRYIHPNSYITSTHTVLMNPESNIGHLYLPVQEYNPYQNYMIFHVEADVQPIRVPGISPCNPLLATKWAVFPQQGATGLGSQQAIADLAADTEGKALANVNKQLGEQIDLFISKLSPAPGNATSLRDDLMSIGLSGYDETHPNGSSTSAGAVSLNASNSFQYALKSHATNNTFTLNFNPWLISSPYPYDKQPQHTPTTISIAKDDINDNDDICERLTNIRLLIGNPLNTTAFYDSLKTRFGDAMTLSLAELTDLVDNCAGVPCSYGVLKKDIELPVFLEPTGYVTASQFTTAMGDLMAEIPGLPATMDNLSDAEKQVYEEVVANYLNHRWGFTMGYYSYQKYQNDIITNTNLLLLNKRSFDRIMPDVVQCIKSRLATLLNNGMQEYREMIAEERKLFMENYVAKCAAPEVEIRLTTSQRIYHYTLYYYDQAGNLIRTVPPEGVQVLTPGQTLQVAASRKNKTPDCNYTGPATAASLQEAKTSLLSIMGGAAGATELWMYDANTSGGQTLIQVNKNYMLNYCIGGGKLSAEIYTLDPNSSSNELVITSSKHYSGSISTIMPWNHIVLQGTNMQQQTGIQLWFNGRQLTIDNSSAACGWNITGNPPALAEDIGKLKHLRTYSRILPVEEIKANAANGCLMPMTQLQMAWYRFNVPNPGDPTTIASNSTQENPFKQLYPQHNLVTSYAYNSTNQVVKQQTPDAGTSLFWYDQQSRLLASRNAKQAGKVSYTKYDDLNRIAEVGQLTFTNSLPVDGGFVTNTDLTNLKAAVNGTSNKEEVTQTVYDAAPSGGPSTQDNLRSRVSASIYKATGDGAVLNATYYSYDIGGNVKTLWQKIEGLGTKKIDYEYDLVSGKVNFVAYQDGASDQFYYQYKYDAENRLTDALSSINATRKSYGFGSQLIAGREDAMYFYYHHGPLARVVLGKAENKVQGIDYAYTLQGWLKGVNGQSLSPSQDINEDGSSVGKDAYAYSLGYYQGDYKPIGGTGAAAFSRTYTANTTDITGQNLYNGNISNTTYAIANINSGQTAGYTYGYDQLNRLVRKNFHDLSAGTGNWQAGTGATNAWKENFSYDANGNISALQRYGSTGIMDNLDYHYNRNGQQELLNNKLRHVKDNVAGTTGSYDLASGQADDNYGYDAIGNLIKDEQAEITAIDWNVYGKIKSIDKAGTTDDISYSYDATGNRVSKAINGKTTYYVRDAQGNPLAMYEQTGSTTEWKEQQLYGSSRLGMWKPDANLANNGWDNTGLKFFELSNHLGNVMAVITDKRIALGGGSYGAEVVSANDYYAFGGQVNGREWSLGDAYRYGFNGHEKDDEVSGEGNHISYGDNGYDPRIGRRWNRDRFADKFSFQSPYVHANNSPIWGADVSGDSTVVVVYGEGMAVKANNGKINIVYAVKVYQNMTAGQYEVHRTNGKLPNPSYTTELARDAHDITSKGETVFHSDKRYGTNNEAPPGTYYLTKPGTNGNPLGGAYQLYLGDKNGSRTINGPDGERAGIAIHQYDPNDSQGCLTTSSGRDISPITNLINAIPDLNDDNQPVQIILQPRVVTKSTYQNGNNGNVKYQGVEHTYSGGTLNEVKVTPNGN